MVVLHIAKIKNDQCNGVCVVVPKHIVEQSKFVKVGFININDIEILGMNVQMPFFVPFDVKSVNKPFDKPNLVVFHEVYYVEYLQIAKNLRKNHIPYVIIPHGSLTKQAQRKKWLKKKLANVLLFNKFIKGAKGIQCLSKGEMNDTSRRNIKFIGTNGVSLPAERKKVIFRDTVNFVYIGRLEMKVKGIDILLNAVKKGETFFKENKCTFDIFGPDTKGRRKKIEKLIKKNGIENLVSMHEAISGKEKERVLLNSDIFIQTSRTEGMPLGILEAMGYGIPCVITEGTRLGALTKEDNAGWVAKTDVSSVCENLIKSVQEKKIWQIKSDNARHMVEQNFQWDVVAKQTILQYQGLIND